MAEFKNAIMTVLKNEGRLADDYRDSGGTTNYGISLKFLEGYASLSRENFDKADIDDDGDVDAMDIKKITIAQATEFYHENFWYKYNYGAINYQPLATKLFDLSVNMGTKQATVCLQRAVRATNGVKLLEDGIFGQKTLKAVNILNQFELMCAYKSEAAGFYRLLAIEKPQSKVYLEGWLNRAYSNTNIG